MKDEKKPKSRTFYRMGFCLLLAVVFLTVSLQTAALEKPVFTGNSRLFNHYGDDKGDFKVGIPYVHIQPIPGYAKNVKPTVRFNVNLLSIVL
jgi:hypothetical protein